MERRSKSFITTLGKIKLTRAYYHCEACNSGFCPRDGMLGFDGTPLSPGVTRMVGLVGAMLSFEEGRELLHELAGVEVNTKQVERKAESLGAEIAAVEEERVEPESDTELPQTMYLGIDGTGIPVRPSEVAGRKGKQPDEPAKTREVKLCTIWSAESRDKDGTPLRDRGSVTYSAAIESAESRDTDDQPSAFAQRVMREAERRRFNEANRRAILADGASYNWNIADEFFPGAIQILDLFHAKEYLSTVAKAIWGPGSKLGEQWAEERHAELDDGNVSRLIEKLGVHAEKHDEARKGVDYFTRNKERMRYPEFREQGLCTSTGVVEAGCKVAIGTRLKRAGMHWTVRGANSIIALRCAKLSGRFDEFRNLMSDRRTAA